ncbi:MAG TPA: glycosyltransferase family 2 protein [Candidatus Cloacimonadota bacterium]|nr:glycosyltransferase family 2 protein [Candidatus Cloacimonadota bacterium]
MPNPRVIVLILTYNNKYLLEDSVSSYLANDYDNYEVVIIDNGSTDGTKEHIEATYPRARVLRTNANLGYSGGFNFGMKYAFGDLNADFALVTNNDVKVDEHAISELVKVAETDSKIGFVTGKVYYFDNPNVLQTVGRHQHPIRWSGGSLGRNEVDHGQYEFVTERFMCDDIFWLIRKTMFDEIGGYDLNFFLQSEDYEWQARAKKYGYRIFYTPYAKLWHKVSMTIGKYSPLKAYYDARNPMIVILMYKSPQFFKRFFRDYVKRIVISSLKNLRKLQIRMAFNQCRGLCSGILWGFKNHKFTWSHFI